MTDDEIKNIIEFKYGMQLLVKDWYEGCPRPLQFVSKVVKLYKKHFGNDYAISQTD